MFLCSFELYFGSIIIPLRRKALFYLDKININGYICYIGLPMWQVQWNVSVHQIEVEFFFVSSSFHEFLFIIRKFTDYNSSFNSIF